MVKHRAQSTEHNRAQQGGWDGVEGKPKRATQRLQMRQWCERRGRMARHERQRRSSGISLPRLRAASKMGWVKVPGSMVPGSRVMTRWVTTRYAAEKSTKGTPMASERVAGRSWPKRKTSVTAMSDATQKK